MRVDVQPCAPWVRPQITCQVACYKHVIYLTTIILLHRASSSLHPRTISSTPLVGSTIHDRRTTTTCLRDVVIHASIASNRPRLVLGVSSHSNIALQVQRSFHCLFHSYLSRYLTLLQSSSKISLPQFFSTLLSTLFISVSLLLTL